MLNRQFETAPVGELLPKPTLSHSALLAAQKPFYQVGGFGADIVPSLSSEDTRKRIADKLDVINGTLNDPRQGLGQESFNIVSEFASSMAATIPLAFLGGEAAGAIAGVAGFGGSLALPEAVLSFARTPINKLATSAAADYLPSLTPAELAKGTAVGYGAYKGMVIPEHVVANYHKENDTLDARGAIKDWAADNYGFLLPIAPLTAGYLLYKVASVSLKAKAAASKARKLIADHESSARARQSDLNFALSRAQKVAAQESISVRRKTELETEFKGALEAGHITQAEHDWYMDYLANPDNHDGLKEKAVGILKDAQIPFDRATGRVWFQLFDSKGIKQLKGAITDQSSTNFEAEEKSALSDYITHNGMDAMRGLLADNPNMVHALKGYTDYIDKKLGAKSKSLTALDEIVDRHLGRGLGKKEIFSQERIFKHLRKLGVEHPEEVPYTVPRSVAYKLRLAKKIDNLYNSKSPQYKRLGLKKIKEDIQKLEEELRSVRTLTPHEELEYIKAKLLTEKGVNEKFRNTIHYQRLRDLADVWANAKHLLHRVHYEHEYERQAAFNKILQKFVSMVDSNASRLANPEKVTQYMKRRIESTVPSARQFSETKSNLGREVGKSSKREGQTEVKEKPEENTIMKENREMVEKSGSEFAANEFKIEENRFNQFKENEEALTNLITCALEKLNG